MRRRLVTAALIASMALGSLALWIAIPAAWLWLGRDLEPQATRFLITVPGCALTMAAGGLLLYRMQAHYAISTGTEEPARPSWLRSLGDDGRRSRPLSLLDVFMVISAAAGLAALVIWWAFLADSPNPSGPLQPL